MALKVRVSAEKQEVGLLTAPRGNQDLCRGGISNTKESGVSLTIFTSAERKRSLVKTTALQRPQSVLLDLIFTPVEVTARPEPISCSACRVSHSLSSPARRMARLGYNVSGKSSPNLLRGACPIWPSMQRFDAGNSLSPG